MKPLLTLNTSPIIQHFLETDKFVFPNKSYKEPFIHHMLALFSTIPLHVNTKHEWNAGKISMAKTMADIPDHHKTDVGVFTRLQIMNLIRIAATVPRGKLLTASQTKLPRYASYTPLFMYAHKRDHGIPYSAWDLDDKRANAAMSTFLAEANDFRNEYPQMVLNNNKRMKLIKKKKLTEWYPYVNYEIQLEPDAESGQQYGDRIQVPKELSIMQHQFWICNAELRDTETMLLDIYSPDKIPKALDAQIEKEEVKPSNEWA